MNTSSHHAAQNHRNKGSGFTLVELLVVIAIIALLSSIVLASLSGARKRGRDGRRVAEIKQLQLALELYYDANGQYPLALSALPGPGYIPAVPKDPATGLDYAYVGLQGAAVSVATCASYHLGAKLEVYINGAGSPFVDDYDAVPGGTYGIAKSDGPVCTGSAWAGNTDIAASTNDFDGTDDSADPTKYIYDMRP